MSSQDMEWPVVGRIAWLNGGLVAVNLPGRTVNIEIGIGGPVLFSFQLSDYYSLFSILVAHGFSVIGATYITDVEESEGMRNPEFRTFFANQSKWRAFEVQQKWSQVAHAAGKKDEMVAMDIAARISTELSYCESRLQSLSEAYAIQLGCKGKRGDVDEEYWFQDSHSQRVYMAIHAMFWEMAVLRDYFAEFAAQFVFGIEKVAKFSKLIPSLSDKGLENDALAMSLLEAGNDAPPGWMTIFSKYRNLFTHIAPVETVENSANAKVEHAALLSGRKYPRLYYPLPGDVMEFSKNRATGSRHKSREEYVSDAINRLQNIKHATEPDALIYLHGVFEKMISMAEMLVDRSSIKPEAIHLTQSDIVGDVTICFGDKQVFKGDINSSRSGVS